MFLLYRTEPSARKVEVVDCNFIAVPLILAVTASRIFYTVTERFVVIPQRASSWFERQWSWKPNLCACTSHEDQYGSRSRIYMPETCMRTCLRHVCEHAWGMLALHPIFQLPKQKLRTETRVNNQWRRFVGLFYLGTFSKSLASK